MLLHSEREAHERDLMGKADWESRAYEREIKYQSEEKERRDWEQQQMQEWNQHIDKQRTENHSRTQQATKVHAEHAYASTLCHALLL